MKRTLSVFAILAILIALFTIQRATGSNPPPPDEEAVRQAIRAAIEQQNEAILTYLLYEERIEQIQFAADGSLASASLLAIDPATDQPIEQEPGLAFARWNGSAWIAILPADPAWLETVRNAPADLLSNAEKDYWLATHEAYQDERPTAAIGGYYLPWEAGQSKYVTQSVGHDEYTPSGTMHFAFDFALNRTHWPIHVARPGTVWLCKEDVPTCDEWTCNKEQAIGNYIVIKDVTTTPTTYQLYLHLDYNSIPDNLCNNNQPVVGAAVGKSQVIGVVDNTGQSWGAHLHFQVHTRASHYFGTAIDVTFDDVKINGGRPRRKEFDQPYCKPEDICNDFQTYYISGNIGSNDNIPPTGNITNLTDGGALNTATLLLKGSAADIGDGVNSVQFLTLYKDTWLPIGNPITANPTAPELTWDWCTGVDGTPIPDGIVSVAMRITDRANNVTAFTGLHHVIKNYACPAPRPACTPNDNQVALFSEANYVGTCKLFSAGTYTNTAALNTLNDNAASLLVGKNVQANLWFDANQKQRGETFLASDNNLADNLIGSDTASALRVEAKTTLPAAAYLRQPAQGGTLTAGDMAAFGWDNGGGATQYQVVITDSVNTYTSPWLTTPYSFTAALPAGSYTWRVQGKNPTGSGAWSAARTFTVAAAPALTTTVLSIPFTHTMEIAPEGWNGTGLWLRTVSNPPPPSGSYSWWYNEFGGDYDTGLSNAGNLTSLPISITTSGGPYFLRFSYKVETEGPYAHWDQRWLQVSSDGGPFVNLWQLADDPNGLWLKSPAFDLSAYAGHIIRLRFAFDTLDANRNAYIGWGVDDVSITSVVPPACAPDGGNIAYGGSLDGTICPGGDVDMFTFTGNAGDEIGANVDAEAIGSSLDPVLTLLDANANTLAENDDQVTELNRDPLIRFKLPATGTYTLKVRAWDHPNAGGAAYNYRLRLYNDSARPTINLTYPVNYSYLPAGNVQLTATASDSGSGIESVAFYWHDNNWLTGKWQFIGVDANASDGWQVTFNANQPDQLGVAVYARAFDQAGNEAVGAAWNIILDHTPPVTQLDPWSETLGSNAIQLSWTGSDNLSGLQRYDLQRQLNSAVWSDHITFTASSQQTWLILPTDGITNTFSYRLRGVDNADNPEGYPASPEVTATLPGVNILCSQPDPWESDNSPISATLVTTGTLQLHNFCNLSVADFRNDEDWLQMNVIGGQSYLVSATPTDESAAVVIEIYASDGTTPLTSRVSSPDYGMSTAIAWFAPANGVNYIRLRHVNGDVIGNATLYAVQVGEAKLLFLPLIRR
jgi:murein DD-endopeptidase MepM/ murein hydrolase activator NlpD